MNLPLSNVRENAALDASAAKHPRRAWLFVPCDLLLRSIASSTFVRMPAINISPELFQIESVSPEADDPQNDMFVIRIRLQGTYEVRAFLSDNGIDDRRIAFAIEELSRSGHVNVSNQ